MTEFLIKSSLSLVVFLFFYHLVLEKEKMHRFNRFFLLFSVVISLVIPFINFEIIQEIPLAAMVESPYLPTQISVETAPKPERMNYTPIILWSLYGIVTLFLAFRFGRNIWKLISKSKTNPSVKYKNAQLVLVQEKILPHTFLNSIFINADDYNLRNIEDELYTHELVHVTQKHTLDILFMEFLKTIFWFNPLFYFYKKAIQLNHEFLADEKVVTSYNNVPFYQSLLLQKGNGTPTIYLASNLNYLVTKKRLIMMTKTTSQSRALLKKIAFTPILAGLIYFFCIEIVAQEKAPTKKTEISKISNIDPLATYFAGVRFKLYNKKTNQPATDQDLVFDKSYEELTPDDKEKFKSFLVIPKAPVKKSPSPSEFENFKNSKKYAVWIDNKSIPNAALDNFSHQDIAYFSGSSILNDVQTESQPQLYQYWLYTHSYFDKNQMGKQSKKYSGDKIEIFEDINKGIITKKVAEVINAEKIKVQSTASEDLIYNSAEKRPEFPGGIQKFYDFIGQNFQAPKIDGLKGRVYIQFIVEADGTLSDIKTIRDIGHGTGEEAVRVLKLSPNWIPGEQDGKKVRVLYSLPISIQGN